jgi:hypothetical protein
VGNVLLSIIVNIIININIIIIIIIYIHIYTCLSHVGNVLSLIISIIIFLLLLLSLYTHTHTHTHLSHVGNIVLSLPDFAWHLLCYCLLVVDRIPALPVGYLQIIFYFISIYFSPGICSAIASS